MQSFHELNNVKVQPNNQQDMPDGRNAAVKAFMSI